LVVTTRLAGDTGWGAAGHVLAWDQFEVDPPRTSTKAPSPSTGPLKVAAGDQGALDGVRMGRTPLVMGDIVPRLWRAPIDNDGQVTQGAPGPADPLGRWLSWGLDRLVWEVDEVRVEREGVAVTRVGRLVPALSFADGSGAPRRGRNRRPGAEVELTVTSDDDGSVVVDLVVDTTAAGWDDLPRVGVAFTVGEPFTRLRWRGPGPDETYPDRRAAALDRVWSATVADQYHPYVRLKSTGPTPMLPGLSWSTGVGGACGSTASALGLPSAPVTTAMPP
jgi:beta-galactosidase